MKSNLGIVLIAGLILSQSAMAENQRQDKYAKYSREDLKAALEILLDSGMIVLTENACSKIDKGLIQELRQEGFIRPSRPEGSVICVDIIE